MISTRAPRHRARRKWTTLTAEFSAQVAGHDGCGRHIRTGAAEVTIVADLTDFIANVESAMAATRAVNCLAEACFLAGTCQSPDHCQADDLAEVEAELGHRLNREPRAVAS